MVEAGAVAQPMAPNSSANGTDRREYEDHRQRDGNGGTQRLGQCDSQHLSAGTLQIRNTEIPSGGKRDIGEREIGDEFHAAGQPCGDQVQCIRSHQDTRQNIARHVG